MGNRLLDRQQWTKTKQTPTDSLKKLLPQFFGRNVALGEVETDDPACREGFEGTVLAAPFREVARCGASALRVAPGGKDVGDAVGLVERKRFEQHGVDETENRRIRTYAQCERQDGHDRESRTLTELPGRKAEVVHRYRQKLYRFAPTLSLPRTLMFPVAAMMAIGVTLGP